jgi:hypothetical protein
VSKRLQILLKDPEYREIQLAARARNMSITEWARQALALVRRNEASGSVDRKLEAIRTAVKYEFPTADIDQMLAEIERGYTTESDS